jgi:hypothetical protein
VVLGEDAAIGLHEVDDLPLQAGQREGYTGERLNFSGNARNQVSNGPSGPDHARALRTVLKQVTAVEFDRP